MPFSSTIYLYLYSNRFYLSLPSSLPPNRNSLFLGVMILSMPGSMPYGWLGGNNREALLYGLYRNILWRGTLSADRKGVDEDGK